MSDDYDAAIDYLERCLMRVRSPGRDGARAQGEYAGFCMGYSLRGVDLNPDYHFHSSNTDRLRTLRERWDDDGEPKPEPEFEPDDMIGRGGTDPNEREPEEETITEEQAAAGLKERFARNPKG